MSLEVLNSAGTLTSEGKPTNATSEIMGKIAEYLGNKVNPDIPEFDPGVKATALEANPGALGDYVNRNLGLKGLHCNEVV